MVVTINSMLTSQYESASSRCACLQNVPLLFQHSLSRSTLKLLVEQSTWFEFEPYVQDMLDPLVKILRADNADNSILGIKILSNLVQYHRETLSPNLNVLLPLIPEAFGKLPGIAAQLDNRLSPSPPKDTLPDTAQLAVLSDFADLTLSIFIAYDHVASEPAQYLPAIISALECQVREKASHEFFTVQGKALSIFAHLLQVSKSANSAAIECVRDFWNILPDITIKLLKECPDTIQGALYLATRNIGGFQSHRIFLAAMPALLQEGTLFGDSLVRYEILRPKMFTFVAEVIRNIGQDLQRDDILTALYLFLPIVSDPSLGTSLQNLSLETLKLVAGLIADKFDSLQARDHLTVILGTIAYNIEFLNGRGPFRERLINTTTSTIDPRIDTPILLNKLISTLAVILETFQSLMICSDEEPSRKAILSPDQDYIFRKLKKEVSKLKCSGPLLGEVMETISSLLDFAIGRWRITATSFDMLGRMVENQPNSSQCLHCKHMAKFYLELVLNQWLKYAPEEQNDELMDSIVTLLDSVATGKLHGLPNLRIIIHHGIAGRPDIFKNNFILRCLRRSDVNPGTWWLIFRDIINPTMAMLARRHWQDGTATIAPDTLESLISHVQRHCPSKSTLKPVEKRTHMEIFRLWAMLIEYCPEYVEYLYPSIIDFSLAFDGKDAFLRYVGLNVIARCLARYKASLHLTKNIFSLLLENGPQECAPLILQGLGFVLPVLFKQCQTEVWMAMRRALTASSNSNIHRTTLLGAVVGEPALSLHAYEQIAIPMMNCLHRTALLSKHDGQSRDLALRVLMLLRNGLNRSDREGVGISKLLDCLIEFTAQQDLDTKPTGRHDAACDMACDLIQRQWGYLDTALPDSLARALTSGVRQEALPPPSYETSVLAQVQKYRRVFRILSKILDIKSREYMSRNTRVVKEIVFMALKSQQPEIRGLVCTVQGHKVVAQIREEYDRMNEKVEEKREEPEA